MSANNSNTLTSLKLSFNGEIRRLSVTSKGLSYHALMTKTLSLYPSLTALQFSWVDDENDTVVLSSDEELSEALRIMATEENKGYLRFKVLTTGITTDCTGTITHTGIMCNKCSICPLTGPRFKCSFRDDYNLCESCEDLMSQETCPTLPTLKIYRPDQLPSGFNFTTLEKKKWLRRDEVGTCKGCDAQLGSGPIFRCTVRKHFDLCESCERTDKHENVMVKLYPPQPRQKHNHRVGNGQASPVPRRRGWRDLSKQMLKQDRLKQQQKFKGLHCWDRASVALAAANRAKKQEEETSRLEDAVLEMCLQESLVLAGATNGTDPVGSSSGGTVPSSKAVDTAGQKGQRRGGGRHCWDRASVTHAADLRRAKQTKPNTFVSVSALAPPPELCVVAKGQPMPETKAEGKQEQIRFRRIRRSKQQQKQSVQWVIEANKKSGDSETNVKTIVMPETKIDKGNTDNSYIVPPIESAFKESATSSLHPLPPCEPNLQHETEHFLDQFQHYEAQAQAETERDATATWSHELQMLCDMGFTGQHQLLLTLLKTHVGTPLSLTEKSQRQVQQHQEGLHAVVLALLSGGNN